jgi:hypothetical protein
VAATNSRGPYCARRLRASGSVMSEPSTLLKTTAPIAGVSLRELQ